MKIFFTIKNSLYFIKTSISIPFNLCKLIKTLHKTINIKNKNNSQKNFMNVKNRTTSSLSDKNLSKTDNFGLKTEKVRNIL